MLGKITRIGMAAVCAVALGGADCKARRTGHVEDPRPPQEKQVDPAKARRFGIEVNGTGPYHIDVQIQDAEGKGRSAWTREDVAAGRYVQTGDYTSGAKVRVRVNVRGSENDKFTCKIIDGLPVPGGDIFTLPQGPAVDWRGPSPETVFCTAVTSG